MPSYADLRLIDALHGGFPLVDRPFAQVGAALGMAEREVMDSLRRLLHQGDLTRFGPLFQIERAGGRFVLAAMAVPEDRFDDVTTLVNALPEVAHNYRRGHALNMWFVVAAESHGEADHALAHIADLTDLQVLAFPKEREYCVELRLPLLEGNGMNAVDTVDAVEFDTSVIANEVKQSISRSHAQSQQDGLPRRCAPRNDEEGLGHQEAPSSSTPRSLSPFERRLMQATQAGLPITVYPYADLAQQLHVSPRVVIDALSSLLADGVIRRIGAVPHHYRLGFVANGMSVWDVDDDQIDALGETLGRLPGVSHCYRRPRRGQTWPYNLFAMLHGRSRDEVERQAAQLRALLGTACRSHDILYSSAVLKKTGLRLRATATAIGAAAASAVEG